MSTALVRQQCVSKGRMIMNEEPGKKWEKEVTSLKAYSSEFRIQSIVLMGV
jgi:hypothetical protein